MLLLPKHDSVLLCAVLPFLGSSTSRRMTTIVLLNSHLVGAGRGWCDLVGSTGMGRDRATEVITPTHFWQILLLLLLPAGQ